jgi:hypothetical protein
MFFGSTTALFPIFYIFFVPLANTKELKGNQKIEKKKRGGGGGEGGLGIFFFLLC